MRKVTRARLENRREDGVFYMEATLDGRKITGVVGNTLNGGQINERIGLRYDTDAEAKAAFDKLLEARGRRYQDQTREEVEVDGVVEGLGEAAREPALESAVREGHAGAETVYADWLQQRGDARGELAAQADPVAHLRSNPGKYLGDLDVALDNELTDLAFRDGFLREASLKRSSMDSETDLAALTASFLKLPVAMFVDRLRFGLQSFESDNSWTETMQAVTASSQAAHLRSLRFDDYTMEDCELSWTPFGDFSDAWEKLHGLEELVLRAGESGELGDIALPKLKRFVRVSGGLSSGEIESILGAQWPQLEQLEIWFGDPNYGAEGNVEMLNGLLAGEVPPTLKHLGLCNAMFANELIEPLSNSVLLRQLRVLDLSKSALMDEDVDLLLAAAPKFAHLERLDLSECMFDERLGELKNALPNARLDEQREGYGDGDRYVAVGE